MPSTECGIGDNQLSSSPAAPENEFGRQRTAYPDPERQTTRRARTSGWTTGAVSATTTSAEQQREPACSGREHAGEPGGLLLRGRFSAACGVEAAEQGERLEVGASWFCVVDHDLLAGCSAYVEGLIGQ